MVTTTDAINEITGNKAVGTVHNRYRRHATTAWPPAAAAEKIKSACGSAMPCLHVTLPPHCLADTGSWSKH